MTKLSNYALTLALLTHSGKVTAICDGTIATITGAIGSCNLAAFEAALVNDCNITTLFGDQETAVIEVAAICEYDAPTQFVEIQGTYQKDGRYFAGGGELVDGENFIIDSGKIGRFETNKVADETLIAWPEYAAREEYNAANGLGDNGYPANMNIDVGCELQTAMCCFTDDNAGFNGDFAANGDDSTDVCRHDLGDSPESNFIKDGWAVFPGAETSTHCVGFTWNTDNEDLIGNMMYDVSLRQTALKGYRNGVPGAPMCGCIESMPTVEKAKCRTASAPGDITYTFKFDAATGDVSASNSLAVTFDDCADGNDLAAQYKANHAGDADAQAKIDEHLATEGCATDLEEYLNEEQFLVQGQHASRYIVPDDQWSDLVVGEGTYFLPPPIDAVASDAAFRALVDPSLVGGAKCGGDTRFCIVRRVCAECSSLAHRDVYYRRLTALPPALGSTVDGVGELYFLDIFMNKWSKASNELNVDFELYSNYEAAVAGDVAQRWTHCDYNSATQNIYGFPRNCGPFGLVGNNWNSYVTHGGYANHHGFYVEKA